MDINWDSQIYVNPITLAQDPNGIEVPTYGNFGGPYWSNIGSQPIDSLDALFAVHDASDGGIEADLALLNSMVKLKDNQLDAEGHLYAGLAELAMIEQLIAEGYHFSPKELARDTKEALHDIQIGLAGLDSYETFLFASWATETGGKLVL